MPFINSASNLFGQSAQGPNVSQFFNPFAGAVGANLQDIFGQQQSQMNGQLTQAAGGVGADRIAVGQSELAKQQGLAAGQTFAGLFQPALGAAQNEQNILQSAGYGMGALGPAAQNSVLSGAQAQLGTGGLQQQLSQAQLNSPYQQRLAQLAYPFQNSQWFSGQVGALAPGLGGTTSGQGTYTPPAPSALSQVLGAGVAGAGLYGGMQGANGGTKGSNLAGGYNADGSASGNQWLQAGHGAGPYAAVARGGAVNPYARGGVIDLHRQADGCYAEGGDIPTPAPDPRTPAFVLQQIHDYAAKVGRPTEQLTGADIANLQRTLGVTGGRPEKYDDGGTVDPALRYAEMNQLRADGAPGPMMGGSLPAGDVGHPIDIAPQSIVPQGQLTPIRPTIPQLNFSQPQGGSGSGSGGGDIGSDITSALKIGATIAPFLAVKRGGRIDPHKFDGANPYAFAEGGNTQIPLPTPDPRQYSGSEKARRQAEFKKVESNPFFRRDNPNLFGNEDAAGQERGYADGGAPDDIDASDITLNAGPGGFGAGQPVDWGAADQGVSRNPYHAFAPEGVAGRPGLPGAITRPGQTPTSGPPTGAEGVSGMAPRSGNAGFGASPWAALTAAGLGMMAGTSPYAGVNIGAGGLQGIKALDQQRQLSQKDTTIEQAAARLDQEAKFHQDQYMKMTPYQQGELAKPVPMGQHIDPSTLTPMTTFGVKQPDGTFKPVDLQGVGPGAANDGTSPSGSLSGLIDQSALHEMAVSYAKSGNTAVMQNLGFGKIGSVNRARLWNEIQGVLKADGKGGEDLAAAKANFMAQSAGARTAAVRGANIDMSVQEAQQTFPLGLEASAALPRSQFVPWNKAVQAVQAGTSSPELARFVTANQAIITAYSQAMSRTGVNTVHAQERAEQLMSTATSQEAYQAVLDQMGKEMHAAKLAPEAVRRDIESKITGRPVAGAPAATTAAKSPQDQQAIDWANANPDDPRSAAIKKRLGVQ